MRLTDPFRPDVEDRLSRAVSHVLEATAYPLGGEPLELEITGRPVITFDEEWSPHVQATLTLAAGDREALMELLDPRFRARIQLRAGYVYDGREIDVHPLAALHVRKVNGALVLEADSDEGLAQDARYTRADGYPPRTGLNELVLWAAARAVAPEVPELVSAFPPRYAADRLTELDLEPGTDYWTLISDVASRTGTWIHVADDGRWHIKARPVLSAASAARLHTGPGGTITGDITRSLDRDSFHNSVTLRYSWQDEERNEYEVTGSAEVPGSGRLGVGRIGRLSYFEDRDGPVTQSQATAAAQTVLSYRLTRGNGIRFTAAAAYWLRPGHTVTVQGPGAVQARHLVRSVAFEPLSGLMTVETRRPETL